MSGGLPHHFQPHGLPIGPMFSSSVAIGGIGHLAVSSISALGPGVVSFSAPQTGALKRDPAQPDTMGWREWIWNADQKCLQSPSQQTLWPTAEHGVPYWDEADVVRGVAGIHALLVPKHWKLLHEFGWHPLGAGNTLPERVTGLVERYGKYVMGTEGWRAEQVVIRELLAPSTEIGLELEQRYPDVIVHYTDQEEPCKSEKLFGLEKGSRSLLPSLPPAQPLPRVQPPSPPPPLPPSPISTPQSRVASAKRSPSKTEDQCAAEWAQKHPELAPYYRQAPAHHLEWIMGGGLVFILLCAVLGALMR